MFGIHFFPTDSLLLVTSVISDNGYIVLILSMLFSAVVFFFKKGVLFPQSSLDLITLKSLFCI